MEKGDIFYFVDMSIGKVTKHKIIEIVKPCTQGKKEGITFSNFKCRTYEVWFIVNPSIENSYESFSKFIGTNKTYMVFTKVEDAQKALIELVLPLIIKSEQRVADHLIKQYHKLIQKVEKIEKEIESNTENFDKKCNVLKNKFV